MSDASFPILPSLAALVQPYLGWRQRQANESQLADMFLPQVLPETLNGLAYGNLPKEPPFTSINSTMTYLPAAAGLMALFGMNGYSKAAYDTVKRLYPNMMMQAGNRMLFDGNSNAN